MTVKICYDTVYRSEFSRTGNQDAYREIWGRIRDCRADAAGNEGVGFLKSLQERKCLALVLWLRCSCGGEGECFFSLEVKTDHRKYHFGFSACLCKGFEPLPLSEKPHRLHRVFSVVHTKPLPLSMRRFPLPRSSPGSPQFHCIPCFHGRSPGYLQIRVSGFRATLVLPGRRGSWRPSIATPDRRRHPGGVKVTA